MNWCKLFGWIYFPVSVEDVILSMCAILLMIPVCIVVTKNGRPVRGNL